MINLLGNVLFVYRDAFKKSLYPQAVYKNLKLYILSIDSIDILVYTVLVS